MKKKNKARFKPKLIATFKEPIALFTPDNVVGVTYYFDQINKNGVKKLEYNYFTDTSRVWDIFRNHFKGRTEEVYRLYLFDSKGKFKRQVRVPKRGISCDNEFKNFLYQIFNCSYHYTHGFAFDIVCFPRVKHLSK